MMLKGELVWQILLSAISLVLIIEGVMPFLSPQRFKRMLILMCTAHDRSLRIMGLIMMLFGLILMYLVHFGVI